MENPLFIHQRIALAHAHMQRSYKTRVALTGSRGWVIGVTPLAVQGDGDPAALCLGVLLLIQAVRLGVLLGRGVVCNSCEAVQSAVQLKRCCLVNLASAPCCVTAQAAFRFGGSGAACWALPLAHYTPARLTPFQTTQPLTARRMLWPQRYCPAGPCDMPGANTPLL